MSFFEDAANAVRDVLSKAATNVEDTVSEAVRSGNQAAQQKMGIEKPSQRLPLSLSYVISDNNTGKEDYVKVIYDLDTSSPIAITEFFDDGRKVINTSKDNIEKFFNKLNSKDNYTVTSAPIDITKISEIPEEFNEGSTVYYDTDAYGKMDARDIFNLRNGNFVNMFGNRKAKRFKPQVDIPYRTFSDELRSDLLKKRTGWNDTKVYRRPVDQFYNPNV